MYQLPDVLQIEIYDFDPTYRTIYTTAIEDIRYHDYFLCDKARAYKRWFLETYDDEGENGNYDGFPHYKTAIRTMYSGEWEDTVVDDEGLEELIQHKLCYQNLGFLSYWTGVSVEALGAMSTIEDYDYTNEILRQLLDDSWDAVKDNIESGWRAMGYIHDYEYDGTDYYIVNHDAI